MTEFEIRTFLPITQCAPITDFFTDVRSPILEPSPTTESGPIWVLAEIKGPVVESGVGCVEEVVVEVVEDGGSGRVEDGGIRGSDRRPSLDI